MNVTRWLQSCRQLMELVHTSSLRLLKTLAPLPFAMIWDLLHWSQWHPRLMMMIIDHGIKIGKYMTETKQKWLKTDKLGRKIYEIWRKRGMLVIFCFCTFKLSNYFLPNCQFLFCQATQFCSAKLNIFARGGQGPLGPSLGTPMSQGQPWSCSLLEQTGGSGLNVGQTGGAVAGVYLVIRFISLI